MNVVFSLAESTDHDVSSSFLLILFVYSFRLGMILLLLDSSL